MSSLLCVTCPCSFWTKRHANLLVNNNNNNVIEVSRNAQLSLSKLYTIYTDQLTDRLTEVVDHADETESSDE